MRRHRARWSALIFGAGFAFVVLTRTLWQVGRTWDVPPVDTRLTGIAGALLLIILGAVGIVVTVLRDRKNRIRKENYNDQTFDAQS